MTPNERRNFRAQRDHRYNRAWWAFFLLGCLAAFVSADTAEELSFTPWLILGGLVGLILRRRHHTRRIARADVFEDLQVARADAAKAAMEREAKVAAKPQAAQEPTAVKAETAPALADSVRQLKEANDALAKLVEEAKLAAAAEERAQAGQDEQQKPPQP